MKETREITGRFAEELVERFGSPLYVFCEGALRDRARRFRAAFERAGLGAEVAYSVKTNYLTAVCKVLREEGVFGEIVSGFEYEVALKAGFDVDKLVFNGPFKTAEELRLLAGRARINVESLEELAMLESIARDETFPVGIRVHLASSEKPWSRFGFSLDGGEAEEAVDYIKASPALRLDGIHAHIGTNLADLEAFATAYGTLCDFARSLIESGLALHYIDLGGGFAAPGARPYGREEEDVPSIEAYVQTVACSVLKAFPEEPRPLVIIEPGRALVSEAGMVLTRVVSRRRAFDHYSVVTDAGINLVPSAQGLSHEVRNLSREGGPQVEVEVRGPLCMQVDFLGRCAPLAGPEAGDILAVYETGAYDFSHSIQFIRLRPAVVMVRENGDVALIRRAETPADLLGLDATF